MDPVAWTVVAQNLPEHARNPIHTDEGARASGFPGALVAGVTTYAYLVHPVVEAWGRDWLDRGGSTVRFHAPVLAGDLLTCAPTRGERGEVEVRAIGPDDTVRARTVAQPLADRDAALAPLRDGEPLPSMSFPLAGELSTDYGARAGDTSDPCQRLGLVHAAVWPAIANAVVHRHVAQGAWVHLRSAIAHLRAVEPGGTAVTSAVVVERRVHKGREEAVLDVRIEVDGEPVARLEHEAIVRFLQTPGGS